MQVHEFYIDLLCLSILEKHGELQKYLLIKQQYLVKKIATKIAI